MSRVTKKNPTFSPDSLGFASSSAGGDDRPFGTIQIGTGLGSAPSGYGSLYDSLFANNPYRNLNYNKSTWQDFLSSLGFRTDADRFQEEAQMNALQWDAGVYQQMYQDKYSSELAKSQRMREAGENPDLLGTGQVEGASAPMEDPQGMTPGSDESGVIPQIASGFMSAFNTAVGIATQIVQLDGLRSDIEGKNIGNAGQMMDIIQQRVLGMTPAEGFKTDKDYIDWKRKVESTLRTNYGRAFFKGSSLRRWNRSIDDFIGTLPTSRDQYDAWKGRLSSAKDYLRGRKSLWDESIDVFDTLNSEVTELMQELEANGFVLAHTKQDADIETATNDLQYQQDLQPGERARAENEQNRRRAEGETFEGILNKHLNNLGKRLDDLSKQGGIKGLIGEIILLLMTMQGNFHISENGGMSFGVQPPAAR